MHNHQQNRLSEAEMQEILEALELPEEAIPLFLQHISDFCHCHGAEKHYQELMQIAQSYSEAWNHHAV